MDRKNMILEAAKEHWRQYGLPPTVRWIRDIKGLSSTSVVEYWLKKLVEEGTLTMGGGGTGTRKVLNPYDHSGLEDKELG